MNFIILITVFMTTVIVVNAGYYDSITVHWNRPLQICGSRLTDYVQLLCHSRYNEVTTPVSDPLPVYRQKRQISNECCSIPCTALYIYENYCYFQDLDTNEDLVLHRNSTKLVTSTDQPTVTVQEIKE